jgi:hypothetical protein
MIKIARPNLNDAPPWYPYFFDLAPGDDLIAALQENKRHMIGLISSIPDSRADFSYAENKWTIKEVFLHLTDEERYYAYKSYCYSRQIDVNLEVPPADKAYTEHFNSANRTLMDIAHELITIREATISLFSNMTPAMLDFKDFPRDIVYSARSLGWMIVGHNEHHCQFIKENYLR